MQHTITLKEIKEMQAVERENNARLRYEVELAEDRLALAREALVSSNTQLRLLSRAAREAGC